MSKLRCVVVAVSWIVAAQGAADAESANRGLKTVFACAGDNDLYRVMTAARGLYRRYTSAAEAVRQAPSGAGVLILADGYPQKTTSIAPAVFDQAAQKNLRLYVEYPTALPDMTVGRSRRIQLERVVVSANVFGESLNKMQLLAIHDCHFVEVQAERPYLVAAKVAGFDTAVYGLGDAKTWPILFEHPRAALLVSTTKLSQFVTARYATQDAMRAVWKIVLGPGRASNGNFALNEFRVMASPRSGQSEATIGNDRAMQDVISRINIEPGIALRRPVGRSCGDGSNW